MPHSEPVIHTHFNALRRRWPVGIVAAATVAALLAPVALGLPNVYRSSAFLLVDQAPDPLGQPNTAMLELSSRLQALRQEMLSRQRALEMAEEFDLYPEHRAAGKSDEVVAMLQRDVKVEPTPGSRGDGRMTTVSFRVSYTGSDSQKVALVTNRLAQFYVDRNGALQERRASRAADQLKQELDQTRVRLDAQEKKVIDFTTVHAGTLPAQMSSITTKYSQLMQQLSSNTGEIAEAMSRRDALETSLAQLSSSTAAADTTDPVVRLAQAQRELDSLTARLTDASPEVRNKRAEIASLQAQVAARTGGNGTAPVQSSMSTTLKGQIADWNTRLEGFQRRNTEIQAEMKKYDEIIDSSPIRNAEFEKISREAASTRTQYDAMQTRYQAALVGERAQQSGDRAEFQVLDPAVPAEEPSAPNRMVLLAIAALLAAGVGVGAMLLVDGLDRSFRSVDELKTFTHVPVLATIPRIVSRKARTRRIVTGALAGVALSAILAAVSVGAFHFAKQAEVVTRMLLR